MALYNFSKIESKIVDQLYFPLCGKIHDEIEREKNHDFEEFVPEELIAIYKKMELNLKPFLKQIEKYYFETYSLASIFLTAFSVNNFDSIEAYLDSISALHEKQLLLTLIAVLQKEDDDKPFTDANLEAAKPYLDDELLRLKLIDDLEIEGDEKWQLSSILRAPKQALEGWRQLLKSVETLYLNYYADFEKEIEFVGRSLMERLNQTEGEALDVITGGRVTKQLIPSGNIVVGFVKMFSIEIRVSSRRPLVYWGIEVETVFNKIKDAADNALINRIQTFKNLGDKTRYEVLRCVAQGMQSTKDIASKLGVSSATISYHLSNLTTSKLINLVREDGKYISQVNHDWIDECFEALKKDLK